MNFDTDAIVSAWKKRIPHPEKIRFTAVNLSLYPALKDFCDQFHTHLPDAVNKEETEGALPGLIIEDRLTYHAVPSGPELEPFLLALEPDNHARQNRELEKLKALQTPVRLELYIAPHCPHCPAAVTKLIPLTRASRHVNLAIIDGTRFSDLAEKNRVRAAPTLIFNQVRWTNAINIPEVIQALLDDDPVRMGPGALKDWIHSGEASRVAALMVKRQTLFPALFELLTHDKWPVRLGAMVVMEEIAHTDPQLAATMVPPLLARFSAINDQIKGDMIYLLGEAGTLRTRDTLKNLLQNISDPELETVTLEAIERISERHGRV